MTFLNEILAITVGYNKDTKMLVLTFFNKDGFFLRLESDNCDELKAKLNELFGSNQLVYAAVCKAIINQGHAHLSKFDDGAAKVMTKRLRYFAMVTFPEIWDNPLDLTDEFTYEFKLSGKTENRQNFGPYMLIMYNGDSISFFDYPADANIAISNICGDDKDKASDAIDSLCGFLCTFQPRTQEDIYGTNWYVALIEQSK